MMDLASLDDGFARDMAEPAAVALPDGRPGEGIPNGFFTLTFPDGSHRTFRVRTEQNGTFAGKRTMAMLIGPDNSSDYESFAFVTGSGVGVWKRFRGAKQERYGQLVWMLATGCEADGHELEVSKRCFVCNRRLTDSESLSRGVGPSCWERIQR